MFSYWEEQSFSYYDHIVIGAGVVGLSTAIEIKEKYPAASVLVLERGLLPTGASTRNAGFACMGSLTELLDDLNTMSEDEVVRLFQMRKAGLERLRSRLGDHNIGYAANGSYELISEPELPALEHMDRLNKLLQPITAKPAYRMASDKTTPFGFAPTFTKALIENTCEGELNSGKMMRALTNFAILKGIEIKTGSVVSRFDEEEKQMVIHVRNPFRHEDWILRSGTLTVCTNAYVKQLLPDENIIPGRGQVLVTTPIPGLKFKGVYHFDKGYYYFREIDGRVLLGGGRNLDFKGEATTDLGVTPLIQNDLEQKLREVIIPGVDFKIEKRWAGTMAFGDTKFPIVKAFTQRLYGVFRMGGMGVALGSEVARQLVAKMD
ncbi:MAG: FAD-dependent oxidoreductase [Bacteroidota bacterium]